MSAGQEVALIPATSADRWTYAESLSSANMLPAQFRGRPADVFYAVEYGAMLGISPIAALTGIHVIEGKPSASSALMSALVRRAGHRLRVRVEGKIEDGTLTATAELIRADDPDHTFAAVWTLDRAVQAGLLTLKREDGRVIPWSRSSKGLPQTWEKYPHAMLKARAISEVARDGAEECLFGAHYTPEELGAVVDQDGDVILGEVVDTPAAPAPVQGARVQQVPQQATPPAAEAAVVEEPDPPAAAPVDETREFAALVARRAAAEADVDVLRATFQELTTSRRHVLDINVLDVIEPAWVAAIGLQPDGAMPLGAWLMAVGRWVKANGRAVSAPVVEDGDGPEDPWALPATDADLPPEARAAAAVLDARTTDDLDRIKTHAGPDLLAVDITWAVADATAAALRLEHGAIELGDLIAAARRHLTTGDGTTVREAVALAAQN